MNLSAKMIGVDVGGTKILLQTFDKQWNLVEEEKVFTEVKKGEKAFIDQLSTLLQKYFHKDIQSIGVALPGIVDSQKGILVKAPHLPTRKNLSLRKILSRQFKCPIRLDNDGNAFLWAQSQRSQLKKYKTIIAVAVGTGVGGALMIDQKLVHGKGFFAGEVGHMVLNQADSLKTLEQNVGGIYIPKIAKKLGIPGKFLPQHLAENTSSAKKVKRHLVHYLGLGLANLNLIFNPDGFVLDGSIYKKFLKDFKKELQLIIAQHALDGKSPLLLDADRNFTAAKGVAMMSLR